MSFEDSDHGEHKKRHSLIAAMLKNYLMHELFGPVPKKLIDRIQNVKLQCARRYVLMRNELCIF